MFNQRWDLAAFPAIFTTSRHCSSGCDFGCIHCQTYFATYCAILIVNSDAINLYVATYGIHNKQAAPRSEIIAMTRFYDLDWSDKRKWQIEHIIGMLKSLRSLKKLLDLWLTNTPLAEIESKLEEISDLMIFSECFRGPLKTLWRATCGPRAANFPTLGYGIPFWGKSRVESDVIFFY